jgi:hypothetical protein
MEWIIFPLYLSMFLFVMALFPSLGLHVMVISIEKLGD